MVAKDGYPYRYVEGHEGHRLEQRVPCAGQILPEKAREDDASAEQGSGEGEPLELLAFDPARVAIPENERERREDEGGEDGEHCGGGNVDDRLAYLAPDAQWILERTDVTLAGRERSADNQHCSRRQDGPHHGPPAPRREPPRGNQ